MGVNNFLEFINVLDCYEENKEVKEAEFEISNYETKENINWLSRIKEDTHVFEIENLHIKKLLSMTKVNKDTDKIMLPFQNIFLDVSFYKNEIEDFGFKTNYDKISGIFLYDKIIEQNNIKVRTISMAYLVEYMKDGVEKVGIDMEIIDFSNIDECEIKIIKEDIKNKCINTSLFIKNFIKNFINFVNTPDVIFVEHISSDKNIKRRIKNGQIPIKFRSIIEITGELKKYLDDLDSNKSFEYSHRFWVRGHFKHQHYKEKIKVIWILPYIKGKGILIKSRYKIIKENKMENEDE